VRAVIGESYIYNQDEELYSKELPEKIEKLLEDAQNPLVGREKLRGDKDNREVTVKPRDKRRVVTYQVPHNSAVQVFDYKTKVSR
jgi:major vault protein